MKALGGSWLWAPRKEKNENKTVYQIKSTFPVPSANIKNLKIIFHSPREYSKKNEFDFAVFSVDFERSEKGR